MWEERAHRARREIAALAAGGLTVSELHGAALRVVDRTVPSDLACWAALDPESLVISSMTSGDARLPVEYEPLLAAAEYAGDEPWTFAELARRHQTIARLSDVPLSRRSRLRRVRTVWQPLGLGAELRVVFEADGASWAAAGLVRSGPDFSEREMAFLGAVAPAVGAATRVAVRSEACIASSGTPAIAVLGADGAVRSATASARDWQDRLDEVAPRRFALMMQVMASGALSATGGTFRARVRDARARWAVLEASVLSGPEDPEVALSIRPAIGEQITGLLMAAYGLSPREREVCRQVMTGLSTNEIARTLRISVHTVHDHLKSIFGKVGVQSRGELVARLRPADRVADRVTDRVAERPAERSTGRSTS